MNVNYKKYICHSTEKFFGYCLKLNLGNAMRIHREESGNELKQTWRQRLRHDLI